MNACVNALTVFHSMLLWAYSRSSAVISGCGILTVIALFCLVGGIGNAVWYGGDSEAEVCINFTVSGDDIDGSQTNTWHDVVLLNLTKNKTFWDASKFHAVHMSSMHDVSLFKYAEDSSNVYIVLEPYTDISDGDSDVYCIYSGGTTNTNDIAGVAPLGEDFDDNSYDNTKFNIYTFNIPAYSINNGILTIDATPGTNTVWGLRGTSGFDSGTYDDIFFLAQIKLNNTEAGGAFGVWSGYYTSLSLPYSNGYGGGVQSGNYSQGFFQDSHDFYAPTTDWVIIKSSFEQQGANVKNTSIYNSNYSYIDGDNRVDVETQMGYKYTRFIAYAKDAKGYMNWSLAADRFGGVITENSENYTFLDGNISILSPEYGNSFTDQTTITVNIKYLKDFDNCTVYVNSVQADYYTGIGSGNIGITILDFNESSYGQNNVDVICYSGGNESSAATMFIKIGADAPTLFIKAFGIDITETCSGATLIELNKCIEYYKLTQYYNFSAVVCENINLTANYSCLGTTGNFTKGGYTIFYKPSYWEYASASVNIEHTGAWFYYNGVPITNEYRSVSMELINSTHFIYGPAQNKERDCGIYYLNNNFCSYWGGFIINTQPVVISDVRNNWYIAGGNLIIGYNQNYSQQVAPVSVLKLVETTDVFNNQSIITRSSCEQKNNTLYVNVVNTLPVVYTVNVSGNTSYAFQTTNYQLITSIPLAGVDAVAVYSNEYNVCTWGSGSSMWLPFNFAWLGDGFSNVLIYIFMLFMVVLSAIIPYAFIFIFIFNDMYQILGILHIASLGVLCFIISLVNSSFSIDRGLKHLFIYMAIFIAFLSSISSYQTELGINLDAYTTLLDGYYNIAQPENLFDVAVGVYTIMVSLFLLLFTLPIHIWNLIAGSIAIISPDIGSVLSTYSIVVVIGIYLAIFLKGYEVVRNTFLKT